MVSPFKPVIGKKRILRSDKTSEAQFTRNIRDQMQAVIKNFENFAKHVDESGIEILEDALKPTFVKSLELVPVDTEELRNSGYLESRKFRNRSVIEMGYGRGGFPNYAATVHEDLEAYHEPPTQAKFLEQPLLEDTDLIVELIRKGYLKASNV